MVFRYPLKVISLSDNTLIYFTVLRSYSLQPMLSICLRFLRLSSVSAYYQVINLQKYRKELSTRLYGKVKYLFKSHNNIYANILLMAMIARCSQR